MYNKSSRKTKQRDEIVVICLMLVMVMVISFATQSAYAHPGNTAADGCHYCRTNCNKWGGTAYGQRHCHRSKGIPQPYEPIRSHRDGTFEIWEPYKIPKYGNNTTIKKKLTGRNQTFTRTLRVGSMGEDVRQLQRRLNTEGFAVAKTGAGSVGNETRYFGPKTKRALIRYQNANRTAILTPIGLRFGTGHFGSMTMRRMNR